MEGKRPRMPSKRKEGTVLLAALLGLYIPAAASTITGETKTPAVTVSGAAKAAAASTQATPNRAAKDTGADPVEDKFRRFQEEMSQDTSDRNESFSTPAATPEPRGLVSLSFQVVLGLAFVLLLAVTGIRLLKRLQGRMLSRPGAPAGGGDLLEVLETCHLGQNQRVVALRINDEVGVLGVTPTGITLLTVLKQPAEEIRRTRMGPGNAAAFSDSLNKLLDRFKKPKRVSDLLDEA